MRVRVVGPMIVVYHAHQWRRLLVVEGPRGRVEELATRVEDPVRERDHERVWLGRVYVLMSRKLGKQWRGW